MKSVATLLALSALAAPTAQARPVTITSATAKSEFPAQGSVSYVAKNAYDGKVATAWTEGDESGSGMGQYVEFFFEGEVTLNQLRIWNGSWASYDLWNRQNRIKDLEITFSDGSKQKFTLTDDMVAETITLEPVKTSSARLTIKSVHNGTTFTDTPIAEVVFFDTSPSTDVPVDSWSSSSVYPADADGNYEPINVADTVKDTMWCEGSQQGDGVGEWIEADFGGTSKVSSFSLINGNGGDMKYWMKANRASKATLSFSDGSTQAVDIKNSFMPQTVSISPVSTSSVRITFSEVDKGKEYNDLCISELSFHQ